MRMNIDKGERDGVADVMERRSGEPDGDDRAAGHLFGNGNAIFLDSGGEQIPELQKQGLRGVHEFRERYPDAPIYWSIWGDGSNEIDESVLEDIRHP